MKIIKQSYTEEIIEYTLEYRYQDLPSCGFSFSCDEHGNPLGLNESALKNLEDCRSGKNGVVFLGIQKNERSYNHPRIGQCDCGEEVVLNNFTNPCYRCGADYNSAGQRLAPRYFWGEETGEHWTECV